MAKNLADAAKLREIIIGLYDRPRGFLRLMKPDRRSLALDLVDLRQHPGLLKHVFPLVFDKDLALAQKAAQQVVQWPVKAWSLLKFIWRILKFTHMNFSFHSEAAYNPSNTSGSFRSFLMKALLVNKAAALAFSLISLLGTRASASEFYECRGFAQTPEYRAGINVESGQASFFDNDTTSEMLVIDARTVYSSPPEGLVIFEGRDAASPGRLRLEFDRSRRSAELISFDSRGHITELGSVPCKLLKTGVLSFRI